MNITEVPSIAIVDDDPIYRKMLTYLLKKNRFRVLFEAENGNKCIALMNETQILPDLVILDVEMAVMDGFETARQLKRKWPQVKIMAHSAMLDPLVKDNMLAAGADSFLVKGYETMNVAEAVWLVINKC